MRVLVLELMFLPDTWNVAQDTAWQLVMASPAERRRRAAGATQLVCCLSIFSWRATRRGEKGAQEKYGVRRRRRWGCDRVLG